MPAAFVLINVETGTESKVASELRSLKSVKDVYFIFGVYDIVVKVEAPTSGELKETITWKIRRLDNVRSTQTLMVME